MHDWLFQGISPLLVRHVILALLFPSGSVKIETAATKAHGMLADHVQNDASNQLATFS